MGGENGRFVDHQTFEFSYGRGKLWELYRAEYSPMTGRWLFESWDMRTSSFKLRRTCEGYERLLWYVKSYTCGNP